MANKLAYGITGYGGYIPRLRMQRAAIASAHKWMAPSLKGLAKGQRAFCSWDEDSVTMAVEAARDALPPGTAAGIGRIYLCSTTLPFADLQHSAIVAGALGLDPACQSLDVGFSQRAGTSALLAALQNGASDTLLIASDRPKGKPGSVQEIGYGAGAAAFTLGTQNVIADLLGAASSTSGFIDHFRASSSDYNYTWEERWIRDEGYMKLVPPVVAAALADAGVRAGDISHFILPCPARGVADSVARAVGVAATAIADNLDENCGYSGSAHGLLMLARVLEHAKPGELLLLVGFGQGCDALVFRVTEAIGQFAPRRGVGAALADGQTNDAYLRMLSYEGGIDAEWGMRAEKAVKTALTEQYRSGFQLAGMMAGKCPCCQTVQFPQLPYCVEPSCNASSAQFEQVSLVDVSASVLTYTADWLSYHPSPPLTVGFVQFSNGARLLMETVDLGTEGLSVGQPLKVVFRIKDIDTARAFPRYFWKTTPILAATTTPTLA